MTLGTNPTTDYDTLYCDICADHPDLIFTFYVTETFRIEDKSHELTSWYEVCASCALSFVNHLPVGFSGLDMWKNT